MIWSLYWLHNDMVIVAVNDMVIIVVNDMVIILVI